MSDRLEIYSQRPVFIGVETCITSLINLLIIKFVNDIFDWSNALTTHVYVCNVT